MVQWQLIFWRSNFTCLFCRVPCAIQRHSYINSWQIKSSARSERLCRALLYFIQSDISSQKRPGQRPSTEHLVGKHNGAQHLQTRSVFAFATICSPIRRKNMFLGCQSSFLASGVWCDNAARLSWKVFISGPRMAKPKFLEGERGKRRFSSLFFSSLQFFS